MDRDLFNDPNLRDINVTPGIETEEYDLPEIDTDIGEAVAEAGWLVEKGRALQAGFMSGKDYSLMYSIGQKLKYWGLGAFDIYDKHNAGELKERFGLEVEPGTTMNTLQAFYAKENKEQREANARRAHRFYGTDQPLNTMFAFGGMIAGNMIDPLAWYSGHAVGALARGASALVSQAKIAERLWKASISSRGVIKSGIGADRAIKISERLRKIAKRRPYFERYPTVTSIAEGGIGNLLEEIGVQKIQATLGNRYELTPLEYGLNVFMPAIFYGIGVAGKAGTRLGIDFSKKHLRPVWTTAESILAKHVDIPALNRGGASKATDSTVGAMATKRGTALNKYDLNLEIFYKYDDVTGKYESANRAGEPVDITHAVNRTIPHILSELGVQKYSKDVKPEDIRDAEDVIRNSYAEQNIDRLDEYQLNDLLGDDIAARELVDKSKDGLVDIEDALDVHREFNRVNREAKGTLQDTDPNISAEWREATNAAMFGLREALKGFKYGKGAKIHTYAASSISKHVKAFKYLSGKGDYKPGDKLTGYTREKDLARAEKEFVSDVIYGDSELEVRFDDQLGIEYDFMGTSSVLDKSAQDIINAMNIDDYMRYTSLRGASAKSGLDIYKKVIKRKDEGLGQEEALKEAMKIQRDLKKDLNRFLKNKKEAVEAGKPLSNTALLKGDPNAKYFKEGMKEVVRKMGNILPKKLDIPLKQRLLKVTDLGKGYKLNQKGELTNAEQLGKKLIADYNKKMVKVRADFKKERRIIIDKLLEGPKGETIDPVTGMAKVIRDDGRVYEHPGDLTLRDDLNGMPINLDHKIMANRRRQDLLKSQLRRAEQMRARFSGEGLVGSKERADLVRYMEESNLRADSSAPARIAEHIEDLKAQLEDLEIDLNRPGISTTRDILSERYNAAGDDFDAFMSVLSSGHKRIVMNNIADKYGIRQDIAAVLLGSRIALNRIPAHFMGKIARIPQAEIDRLFARKVTIKQFVNKFDKPYRRILRDLRKTRDKIAATRDKDAINKIQDTVLKKYDKEHIDVIEDIKRVLSGEMDWTTFGNKYLLAPEREVEYYKKERVGTAITDVTAFGRGLTGDDLDLSAPNVYNIKDSKGNLRPTLILMQAKTIRQDAKKPSYKIKRISANGMLSSFIRSNDLMRASETLGKDTVLRDFGTDKNSIAAQNANERRLTWDSKLIRDKATREIVPTQRAFRSMFREGYAGGKVDEGYVLNRTGLTREQVFEYLEERGRIHPGADLDKEVLGGLQQFTEGGINPNIGDPRLNTSIGKTGGAGAFDAAGNVRSDQDYLAAAFEDLEMNQLKSIDAVGSGASINVDAFPNVSKTLLDRINRIEDPMYQAVLLSKHRLDGSTNYVTRALTKEQKEKGLDHYDLAVKEGQSSLIRNKKRTHLEIAAELYPSGATPANAKKVERLLRKAERALKDIVRDDGVQRKLDRVQKLKDDLKQAEGLKLQEGKEATVRELKRRLEIAERATKGLDVPKRPVTKIRKASINTQEIKIKTYLRGIKNRMFDRDAVLTNLRDDIIIKNKRMGLGLRSFVDEYSFVLKRFIDYDPRFADLKPQLDELLATKVLVDRYGDGKFNNTMEDVKEFLHLHEASDLNVAEVFPFLKDPIALTKHAEAVAKKQGLTSGEKVLLEDLFKLDDPMPLFRAIDEAATNKLKNHRRRETDVGVPEKPLTAMDELEIDSPDVFRKIKETEDNLKRCMDGEPMKPEELMVKKHLVTPDAEGIVRYNTDTPVTGKGLEDVYGRKIGRGAAESKPMYNLSKAEIDKQLRVITKFKVGEKDAKQPKPQVIKGRIHFDNKEFPDVNSFVTHLYGKDGVGKVITDEQNMQDFLRAQLKLEQALLSRPVGWTPQKAVKDGAKADNIMRKLGQDPSKTVEEISLAAHGGTGERDIQKTLKFLGLSKKRDPKLKLGDDAIVGLKGEMEHYVGKLEKKRSKADKKFRERREATDARVKRLKDRRNE